MATTGKFTGEKIGVTVDGAPMAEIVSYTLDTNTATSSASTMDSEGHNEYLPSWSDGTLGFDGMVVYDATTKVNFMDLYSDGIIGKTVFTLVIGTSETGDSIITQDAILTSLSQNATAYETVSYSGSFQFTGKPTVTPNP